MKDLQTKQRKQMIKEMKNGKGHWGNCCIPTEKLVVKKMAGRDELNFLQAFIILVITLVLFTVIFHLAQRAMDIQAVHNCELRGDCSEVIRDINK